MAPAPPGIRMTASSQIVRPHICRFLARGFRRPLVTLLPFCLLTSAVATATEPGAAAEAQAVPAEASWTPLPEVAPPVRTPETLVFEGEGREGQRFVVAAVGDLMAHSSLQRQAYEIGYETTWASVASELYDADLTYGNLEMTTAPGLNQRAREQEDPGMEYDGEVYSGYPLFNAHPSILDTLETAGFDVLSTANNHSHDRRGVGIERTIDELDARGLAHMGTRRVGDPVDAWFAFTDVGDFRIAWLACARHLNGRDDDDAQVLHCFEDPTQIESLVGQLADRADVDAVVVTPHWGRSYESEPDEEQTEFARRWIDAGAVAVLGSHPHVLQPVERYTTGDGRDGLIAYSMGNFVGAMRRGACDQTAVFLVSFVVDGDGEIAISDFGWIPLRMRRDDGEWRLTRPAPGDVDHSDITNVLGAAHEVSSGDVLRRRNLGVVQQPHAQRLAPGVIGLAVGSASPEAGSDAGGASRNTTGICSSPRTDGRDQRSLTSSTSSRASQSTRLTAECSE